MLGELDYILDEVKHKIEEETKPQTQVSRGNQIEAHLIRCQFFSYKEHNRHLHGSHKDVYDEVQCQYCDFKATKRDRLITHKESEHLDVKSAHFKMIIVILVRQHLLCHFNHAAILLYISLNFQNV